ncbi:MAG: glucose 1-dehydrogenase, partial [Planctomycetota bacterium]
MNVILDDFRLNGDIALVTGASRGLGRAMAVALAEAGADVAVTARSKDALEETARLVKKARRKALAFPANVEDKGAVELLIEAVLEKFGKIDILVNNVGATARYPAEDFPLAEWDRIMDVNVRSVFVLTNLVVQSMKTTGGGRIINTASLLSEIGVPFIPPYAASKGAIRQLTKAWAVEWAKYGIRVNAIGPGYMRTEMTEPLYQDRERHEMVMNRVAIKRWGTSDDMKGAVVFLASRASDYITGQIIY